MITLSGYVPYKKRSTGRKIAEAATSAILFVIAWISLVLVLGLSN